MSARKIVGGLAGAAVGAVKHPVGTAGEAISKAKGVVSAGTAVGTAVAGSVVGKVRGGASEAKNRATTTEAPGASETAATQDAAAAAKETVDKAAGAAKGGTDKAAETVKATTDKAAKATKDSTDKAADAAKATTDKAADVAKSGTDKAAGAAGVAAATAKKAAKKAPTKKSTAKKAPAKKSAKREPQVVLAEPAPPVEPPVDVVGQALAAEQEVQVGAGRSTEPRAGSRDEEHGEASLQRSEAAQIMEEIAEASDLGQLDIETPVGTTGADVGNNPDTAEADLQQPGTEPLLDPSLTKEIKSEQDTLHQAAEPQKPRPKKKS